MHMKKLYFLQPLLIVLILGLSSFSNSVKDNRLFIISINGTQLENLKDGLKVSELGMLKINMQDENVMFISIEISLTRGTRAVQVQNIKSNHFDLGRFKSQARAGDRIVLEIKARKVDNLTPTNYTSTFAVL